MTRPFEITDAGEILTDEVVANLRVLFHQLGLSMTDVYVRLAEGEWRPVHVGGHEEEAQSPFCVYLRETEPFKRVCDDDRTACCDKAMKHPGKPVHWYCPYGLRVIAMGFRVGRADVVLRSNGWYERGQEGPAIHNTLCMLEKLECRDHWDTLMPLLRQQARRTDAEIRRDAEGLKGLFSLVHDQAQAVYERRVDQSKGDLLREIRELVYPLMAEFVEERQVECIRKALKIIRDYFSVRDCVFYFTRAGSGDKLIYIAADGANVATARTQIPRSTLGSTPIGVAHISRGSDLSGLAASESMACTISLPDRNAALLAVAGLAEEDNLLDEHMISELTRILSVPLCMSSFLTGFNREAELRRLQARNSYHIVRNTFQAIAGDAGEIRYAVRQVLRQMPSQVEEPVEHLEEMIRYTRDLLSSYEFVEHQFLKGTRPLALGEKKPALLINILRRARESFVRRAAELRIEINLEKSAGKLSPVDADVSSVSLLFVQLLHNALKYSHRGSKGRHRTIDVSGHEDGHDVYIEISDFGVGIHPREEEGIFETYVQGSIIDETRLISGQGIGLAVARQIARMHDGDVALKRCVAYDEDGSQIPMAEIMSFKPGSKEASELLQHCLVVFEARLPKRKRT